MVLIQVYRNEYVEIEAKHQDKLILLTWLQHSSSESSREILQIALQYARTHELTRWMHDLRKMNYITIADQNWTVKEFFPSFDFRFHHRIACLASSDNVDMLPDNIINELMQQNPIVAERIEMKVFLNKGQAEYWLLS